MKKGSGVFIWQGQIKTPDPFFVRHTTEKGAASVEAAHARMVESGRVDQCSWVSCVEGSMNMICGMAPDFMSSVL
jgi:hypothetical protein